MWIFLSIAALCHPDIKVVSNNKTIFTNQSSLFHHSVTTLCWNLFMTSGPAIKELENLDFQHNENNLNPALTQSQVFLIVRTMLFEILSLGWTFWCQPKFAHLPLKSLCFAFCVQISLNSSSSVRAIFLNVFAIFFQL